MANTIRHIRKIKTPVSKPYFIRAIGLYNPYPAWTEATEYVIRFNRHLMGLGDDYFRVADIYAQFSGREKELMSVDGLHPNGRGYRVIAEQLNRLGYKPLA